MKYMGSKNRIAKYIIPFFEKVGLKENLNYWEPFVGGANIIDKVFFKNKLGSDINIFLIEMFKKLQSGWIPPKNISKEEYDIYRKKYNTNDFTNSEIAKIGFIGFICSYGGRFYDGGYANISGNRNYQDEAYRNIMSQVPNILNVKFFCSDYSLYTPKEKTLIYCDIPYKNTKGYSNYEFNHDKFFDWCRKMSSFGHHVFISEYKAPDDFQCLWEKEIKTTLKKNGTVSNIEKLFYIGDFNFKNNKLF